MDIPAAITSLIALKDMAQGLKGFIDEAESAQLRATLLSTAADALGALFIAQQEKLAISQEKEELAEKLRKFENWQTERDRYQLTRIEPGTLVYLNKPDMTPGEPQHHLCATCFENGKKSFLQPLGVTHQRYKMVKCNTCEAISPML